MSNQVNRHLEPQNVTVPAPRAVFFFLSVGLSMLPDQAFFLVSNFLSKHCLVSLFLWKIWKWECTLPMIAWPSLREWTPPFALVLNLCISAPLDSPWHVSASWWDSCVCVGPRPNLALAMTVFEVPMTFRLRCLYFCRPWILLSMERGPIATSRKWWWHFGGVGAEKFSLLPR